MRTDGSATGIHERSLREITAELDGLRELLLAKIDNLREIGNERHQLYGERDDSRRIAVDAAFAAQKEAINAALAAADRAVLKAEMATEKRFEGVNEFRATLDQQQRTLIPRMEVDVLVKGLNDKLDVLTKHMDMLEAERAGIKGGWGYAVGAIGFLLTLGSLIMIGLRFVSAR